MKTIDLKGRSAIIINTPEREKIPVAVMGATGLVGRQLIEQLVDHPWFDLVAVAASESSSGTRFIERVPTMFNGSAWPDSIAELSLCSCHAAFPSTLLFSTLPSLVAKEIERMQATRGQIVISNASAYRNHPQVPLIVPEVNPHHLSLLKMQSFGKGKILTNPNCIVIPLVLSLKPLLDHWPLRSIAVSTLQSISGAGSKGVPSWTILDNVLPFIAGEEEKIESEPQKLFGKLQENGIEPANIAISAHCARVAVKEGHVLQVSVACGQKPNKEEILSAWKAFQTSHTLPSQPSKPIHYWPEEDAPQPRHHSKMDRGMAIHIGQLRRCSILDYKFTVVCHNLIRGAAGAALLNAELAIKLQSLWNQKERNQSDVELSNAL